MATAETWHAWYRTAQGDAIEQVTEQRHAGATRRRGVVLGTGPQGDSPFRFDYDVLLHPAGTIRRADLSALTPTADTQLTLTADGFGHWFRHGVPVMELTGCLDITFWCSPQAAVWPLARLALDFGAAAALPATRITGPDLEVAVQHLTYRSESADAAGTRCTVARGGQAADDVRLDPEGRLVAWAGRWHRV